MSVKVVVPFKWINPKSRLSGYLSREEREKLAICMLEDVLSSLISAKFNDINILTISKNDVTLISEILKRLKEKAEIQVVYDNRELSAAINQFTLKPECLVVMSDLPLLTPEILRQFVDCKADLVLSPGRRGGTNMLLTRVPFKTSYHYGSFFKHLTMGKLSKINVKIFDSFFAGIDIDTPEDLLEVMLHGTNTNTGKFLRNLGFRVCLAKNPILVRKYL